MLGYSPPSESQHGPPGVGVGAEGSGVGVGGGSATHVQHRPLDGHAGSVHEPGSEQST